MALSILLLFLPFTSSISNFPIVQTGYGAVRGYEYRAKNGFGGEIFKKIPFASPPIGVKRWQKADPPEAWNYTLDATFFGPACAQRTTFWQGWVTGFSEDCLLLNIYTSKECRESNASCPVVLYIHGGIALFDGTMMFPDEALITNFATQGVIIVTVAYRLGVFGVMALGDENVVPANLAVHDVLESLLFVRKEIHNFGGDKDQISIMGHSTGATIVLVMAFSPGINVPGEPPLFARAIAMSGTMNLETAEQQVERSHGIAKELGCGGTAQEIIDCLLPFSTDDLLNTAFKVGGLNAFSKQKLNDITLAGELFPIRNVRELRTNPKPVKLMLGTTLYEFELKPFNTSSTARNVNEVNWILGVQNVEECSEKYLKDVDSGKFASNYSSQSQSIYMTNWLYSNAQANVEGGEVYLYQYDYPANAIHTDDAYYVMGFHEHSTDINERWIGRVYPIYFTNFIKGLPLAPDWKPVNPELMNYYSVNKSFTDGVVPKTKLGYHHDLSDYYVGMLQYDDSVSKIKKKLLNAPVQYKEFILLSTEPVNIRDIMFYSTILGILLFIIYKFYQGWRSRQRRQRREEESPLICDRLNNNV